MNPLSMLAVLDMLVGLIVNSGLYNKLLVGYKPNACYSLTRCVLVALEMFIIG